MLEAGQGLLGAGMSYLKGDMSGLMKGVMGTFKSVTSGGSSAAAQAKQTVSKQIRICRTYGMLRLLMKTPCP